MRTGRGLPKRLGRGQGGRAAMGRLPWEFSKIFEGGLGLFGAWCLLVGAIGVGMFYLAYLLA